MKTSRAGRVSRQVHQLLASHAASCLSDRELLQRYLAQRDEDSFAALVHRHGPLVLKVCRGLLRLSQDVEDVFQATFLLLARKAGSIRKQHSVGSWLYGVAYRLARRVQLQAGQRAAREAHAHRAAATNPVDELTWRELHEALHGEMERLPDRYRAPLLLCYWEGLTHEEAAVQLGWKKATVKVRLERGRALLRGRLARRGLSLAVALPAVVLAQAPAPASPLLLRSVTEAACWYALGQPAAAPVSASAMALAGNALRAMSLVRVRRALCWLLVLTTLAGAGWAVAHTLAPVTSSPAPLAVGLPPAEEQTAPAENLVPPRDLYGDPLPPGALARLGTLRLRHDLATGVGAMAFTADGKVLATAGFDRTVRLWQADTGKALARWQLGGPLRALAFSPDGKTLAAAGGGDFLIRLWDVDAAREVRSLNGHHSEVLALAWSPDGKQLTSAAYEPVVRTWDVGTGKEVATISSLGPVFAVAFSPDGKTLAVTSPAQGKDPGLIRLWDVANGKEVSRFVGHKRLVTALAFSADSKVLAWADAGPENTVHLWGLAADKEIGKFEGDKEGVAYLAFAPDARTLVGAAHNPFQTVLWDLASGKRRFSLENTGGAIAYSPDGKTLAVMGSGPAVQLLDPTTGKERLSLARHANPVFATAISPDGKTIVTHDSQALFVWDAATGKLLRRVPTQSAFLAGVKVLPDGNILVLDTGGPTARFREATTAREISRCEMDDVVATCVFSADGKTAAVAGLKSIRVLEVATGKEVRRFDQGATWLAFAPDGKSLVSVKAALSTKEKDRFEAWDLTTGAAIGHQVGSGIFPHFSPDGAFLALRDPAGIHVNDPATQREIFTIPLKGQDPDLPAGLEPVAAQLRGTVFSDFAFSPDGSLLATADEAGAVHVWGLAIGQEVACFPGHGARVVALVFSADGRLLVTGSDDTTALVWDLSDSLRKLRPLKKDLDARDLDRLWQDLASADGAAGYKAIVALLAGRDRAVSLLQERLPPAKPARFAAWIAELDHDDFQVRKTATSELRQRGLEARPALLKALADKPSLEVRQRLEDLLDALENAPLPPETLRSLRAVLVLEHLGTRQAQETLEQLARGAPEAQLTQAARLALERLKQRPSVQP